MVSFVNKINTSLMILGTSKFVMDNAGAGETITGDGDEGDDKKDDEKGFLPGFEILIVLGAFAIILFTKKRLN